MPLRPTGSPSAPSSLLPVASAHDLPAALRAGRAVQGRVRADSGGELVVAVGRARLPLTGQHGLSAGQPLTVRLVTTANGPALEIETPRRAASPAANELLRHAIPRQRELGALLAALRSPPRPSWNALSIEQRQSAEALLDRLASSTRMQQADGLRTALRDSGVLLEWLLARYPQAAEQIAQADFKVALLRLIARLRGDSAAGSPPATDSGSTGQATLVHQLLEQAEGVLARLQLLQLQPLQSPDRPDLAFQIPLAHGNDTDDLYLRIRQKPEDETDPRQAPDKRDRAWEVTLRFRFAGTEALAARLTIAGRRTSVTWWAEDAQIAAAVETARPLLTEKLQALDLEVDVIRCHRGHAPSDPSDSTRPQGGLIHESA